jgi:CRISPR-associated protein Csb3
MNEVVLPGDEASAFDHLAGYGVAAILDAYDPGRVRLGWTDELEPRLRLFGTDWDTIARVVHAHASAHTAEDSWVQADRTNSGSLSGLFSPRVKAMSGPEARAWHADRDSALDHITGQWAPLDYAMVGALGMPSYWSYERGEPRPDYGASRWEMKTRNRGEDFVANRLRLLARAVAARTPEQVAHGLEGTACADEVGKGGADSRTPTGLTAPQPVDNARAWCALWGISLLPVSPSVVGASQTAGHVGHHSQGYLYLPLMTGRWPLALLRCVLRSAQLRAVTTVGITPRELSGAPVSDAERVAAWLWLGARGVPAVVRFPVFKSPNKSAPEKWAQRGVRLLPTTV